jgi:peptidoglycan LD-endopeptidase LytH
MRRVRSREPEEETLYPLVLRTLLLVLASSLVLLAVRSTSPSTGDLLVPVRGVSRAELNDSYRDLREGSRPHDAIDILAPWGTPVLASTDGIVERIHESARGGLGVTNRDPAQGRCYYYAHLARYAHGLRVGDSIRRGEVLGFVGSTGNASEDTPHLHFAVYEVGANESCADGRPLNPYPLLLSGGASAD